MAITRRELAGILAATAAAIPAAAAPQTDDEETRSAHDALKEAALQLDKVALPMATEPACRFRA